MACKRARSILMQIGRSVMSVSIPLRSFVSMDTERGGGVGAKSSTTSTGGEKETSWHLKGHDSSITTCAFFITKGRYPVGI